jgi:hypothetical protein
MIISMTRLYAWLRKITPNEEEAMKLLAMSPSE